MIRKETILGHRAQNKTTESRPYSLDRLRYKYSIAVKYYLPGLKLGFVIAPDCLGSSSTDISVDWLEVLDFLRTIESSSSFWSSLVRSIYSLFLEVEGVLSRLLFSKFLVRLYSWSYSYRCAKYLNSSTERWLAEGLGCRRAGVSSDDGELTFLD